MLIVCLVTRLQRAIIICGVLALVVTGLFPPWAAHLRLPEGGADITRPAGYHWISSPPSFFADYQQKFVSYYIDTTRLLSQWLVIVLVVIGLVFAVQKRLSTSNQYLFS